MTLHPLGFDFPLTSALSTRPPHAVNREEQRAELERELADRSTFYQRMVERGKMDEAAAAGHIDTLRAIADDLDGDAGAGSRHSWDAKVRELRRELAIRRSAWPKRIANGADPLDQPTASLRMERFEAVHFAYWIELRYCDEFGSGATLDEMLDHVRARVFEVMAWEREQWLAGGDAARIVRPRMAQFYAELRDGRAGAMLVWNAHEAAARRYAPRALEAAE